MGTTNPSELGHDLAKGPPLSRKRGELERPRRFYKSVSVVRSDDGWAIALDGRAPKTPGGTLLVAPSGALAELVAGEWSAQLDHIEYAEMPATRMLHSAIDIVARSRSETEALIVRYAGSDLLCYLADGPESLIRRQQAAWGPIIDWARDDLGVKLIQTRGVVHQVQPAASLSIVERIAAEADVFSLTGMAFGVPLLGSSVLAMALRAGRIDAVEAHAASRVDECFQEERWGVDEEAAGRSAMLLRDTITLERWFAALRAN